MSPGKHLELVLGFYLGSVGDVSVGDRSTMCVRGGCGLLIIVGDVCVTYAFRPRSTLAGSLPPVMSAAVLVSGKASSFRSASALASSETLGLAIALVVVREGSEVLRERGFTYAFRPRSTLAGFLPSVRPVAVVGVPESSAIACFECSLASSETSVEGERLVTDAAQGDEIRFMKLPVKTMIDQPCFSGILTRGLLGLCNAALWPPTMFPVFDILLREMIKLVVGEDFD